jgi:hypothetical protein
VTVDGVHFEQSTCYQRYTIEIYQHFVVLAGRNNIRLPANVDATLSHMIEFLLSVRRPDGTIPAIGDMDGGWLLPLVRRSADDARGIFATAATMFDRRDFAWAAGGSTPEVVWFLGVDGLIELDALQPSPPAGDASRIFATGGYAVMRDGWDVDAHQMITDIGPLGCPVSAGHGHADLLSIQCAVAGKACLVDAGNYCYTSESRWRDYFRSTAAHNTVMIDGQGQADPAGPFGWRVRPHVLLREWRSNPELDYLDAEHDAYGHLDDPVVHRRRLLFVKPRYWIVVDDLVGAATHQVDLVFQFAPIFVTLGPEPWARARTPSGSVLWVAPFGSVPLRATLRSGDGEPIRGWIAPDYGQREPAPALLYTTTTALPMRILTLLLPDPQSLLTPPVVTARYDDAGLPTGLVFERSGESVHIEERAIYQS